MKEKKIKILYMNVEKMLNDYKLSNVYSAEEVIESFKITQKECFFIFQKVKNIKQTEKKRICEILNVGKYCEIMYFLTKYKVKSFRMDNNDETVQFYLKHDAFETELELSQILKDNIADLIRQTFLYCDFVTSAKFEEIFKFVNEEHLLFNYEDLDRKPNLLKFFKELKN